MLVQHSCGTELLLPEMGCRRLPLPCVAQLNHAHRCSRIIAALFIQSCTHFQPAHCESHRQHRDA